MRRYGPAVLLALVGAAILRVSLFSDLYLRYVQPGLRPYLVVSGAALVLLAGVTARTAHARTADDDHRHADGDPVREGDRDADGDPVREGDRDVGRDAVREGDRDAGHGPARGAGRHGDRDPVHEHTHGPRVAWLLALPAAALLLFPPPALGSYSAERDAARRAAQGVGTFPALPDGNPVDLTLGEFGSRAVYDSGHSLRGRTVRLTGFVTRDADGTWYVTRLLVSCCAADASTAKAEVRGADAPAVDTWVSVTGTWHPEGALGSDAAWPPVVDATSVRPVPQPGNPYEQR
ncbi:TIGR03943 family protein [Streptomyces sp. NPDC029554]|uniref:TIGR03943 family putative permease subunit n=1 Tax=Streptomyces sp. NPDC029554 TaxID=3155126 RepID=UPI0034109F58